MKTKKTKQTKRWKPEFDEHYWVVEMGIIEPSISEQVWVGDPVDVALLKEGNCFRAPREATAALKRVKAALKEVR